MRKNVRPANLKFILTETRGRERFIIFPERSYLSRKRLIPV
jgi:hypothetical protein